MSRDIGAELRSCNHSCSGKAIRIRHSVCVFVCVRVRARVRVSVGLVIQHEMRMRRIVICCLSLPGCTVFPHYILKGHDFRGGV